MNIGSLISRFGKCYGDKTAIVFGDKRFTYAEMTDRINRISNSLLELGVKEDDRVALVCGNCPQFMEVYFARRQLGLVEVNIDLRLSAEEWVRQINECEVNTIFIAEEQITKLSLIRSELERVKNFIAFSGKPSDMVDYETLISSGSSKQLEIDLDENKLCKIIFTGGTTGRPKGVEISRRAELAMLRNVIIDLVPDLHFDDVFVGLQPMYHAVHSFFFPCWRKGATQVVVPDFHPEPVFDVIEKEKITIIKTVPTVLIRLISHPDVGKRNLKSIRTICYGASPMSVDKLKKAISIFGSVFIQNYGQVEAPMTICTLSKKDHVVEGDPKKVARLASVGQPYSWVEVKIVDEAGKEVVLGETGELIVRSEHQMTRYLNRPEETDETLKNGWIYTGDIARMDDEGYIFLVDRKNDMIITGGLNVFPGEIEQILYRHPEVVEASVFSIPDDRWGESIIAAVALKPGSKVTQEKMIDFCKQHLAHFKVPQKVTFHDSLPKSSAGKILRRELRAPYWKGYERAIH